MCRRNTRAGWPRSPLTRAMRSPPGQVVATISSPETEAQLRSAQAQVLKAKQAQAEAVALIAQRDERFDILQDRL